MPDAYDQYLARKAAGAAGPVGGGAPVQDAPDLMQDFYRGKQEESGVREKPKEPDPYDRYLATKPIDFDTKRDLIRRLGLQNDIDPDYKGGEDDPHTPGRKRPLAKDNEQYQKMLDYHLDRAAPGLSKASMLHAERVKAALKDEPTTAGETATALAGDFNRSFLAPARGIADKMFGPGGPLANTAAHEAGQNFGTGDDNPRLAKAREALDKTFLGRTARGVVGLPGMVASVKGAGEALGAGGVLSEGQAGMGAMGLYSGLSEGSLEAAGGGVAMGSLGTVLSKGMSRFMAGLDPVKKSLALQKIASVGSEGAGWALSDAILNGPDGERALTSFLFGAGLSMTHGARGVTERVDANRARTLEGLGGDRGLPQGEIQSGPPMLESGLPRPTPPPTEMLPEGPPAPKALPQGGLVTEGSYPETYPREPVTAENVRALVARGKALQVGQEPPPVEPQYRTESTQGFRRPAEPTWVQPPEAPPNAAGTVENVGKRGKEAPRSSQPEAETDADLGGDVVDLSPLPFEGKGRSQRGAVGGPLTPEEAAKVDRAREFLRGAVRGTGRAIRATWEGYTGAGLDDLFRFAPKAAGRFAQAADAPEWGKSVGTIFGSRLREGMTKAPGEQYPGERFDYAVTEEQLRSKDDTYRERATTRHGKRFAQLFPTDAALEQTVRSPEYADFVKRHQAIFDSRIQPMNERATGRTFDEPTRGVFSGVRSNLLPLTEPTLLGGRRASVGRGGIRASSVGREFSGGAYDYDPRLENQYASAAKQAQEVIHTKAAIEEMVRSKQAEWYDGNPNRQPPPGWKSFDLTKSDQGVTLADSKGQPVKGSTLWIRPEFAPEVRSFFKQNQVEQPRGIVSKVGKAVTAAQLMSPVDKIFHSLNLAAVNYRLGGLDAFSNYKRFSDPLERAQAQKRMSEIGAAKPEYAKSTIGEAMESPRLDAFLDKARVIDLDRVDLAVRTSVLDHTEARIRKGLLPDTLETRRDAVIQAGNYNARTQDYVVRFLKRMQIQPFAVAARTMFANAVRSSPLGGFSTGVKAKDNWSAVKLRSAVAAKWVAYLAAAGANNYALTGDFAPLGFGVWVSPFGKKDGEWQEWGLPGAATGFSRMMNASGTGAAGRAIAQGGSIGDAAAAGGKSMGNALLRANAGGPMGEAAATSLGMRLSLSPGQYDPSWENVGKGLRQSNAWVDMILGLFDPDEEMGQLAHDTFGPVIPRSRK